MAAIAPRGNCCKTTFEMILCLLSVMKSWNFRSTSDRLLKVSGANSTQATISMRISPGISSRGGGGDLIGDCQKREQAVTGRTSDCRVDNVAAALIVERQER